MRAFVIRRRCGGDGQVLNLVVVVTPSASTFIVFAHAVLHTISARILSIVAEFGPES